jgi:hypothetical protein
MSMVCVFTVFFVIRSFHFYLHVMCGKYMYIIILLYLCIFVGFYLALLLFHSVYYPFLWLDQCQMHCRLNEMEK